MQIKARKTGRLGVALIALLAVSAGLSGRSFNEAKASMRAEWLRHHAVQAARAAIVRATPGVAQDWSHRHLIFSRPGSEDAAIQNGRYDSWLSVTNDPRFAMQEKTRSGSVKTLVDRDAEFTGNLGLFEQPINGGGNKFVHSNHSRSQAHRDWAIGVGAGSPSQVVYPGKWNLSADSATCGGDFVLYPTGALGTAGQASIIAYFNLYSGCTGTVPSVAWAFNTGGTITGAPSFSYDGTQVAFIQSNGGVATLVLLKLPTSLPGTGTLGSPTTLSLAFTPALYPACTAPCMTSITLNGSPADTWSNPWVDYASDSLFVGDNAGKLHKFTPVFNGTASSPAKEVTTLWPVTLDASPIASPVFDAGTGKVFVGSGAGFFYAVGGGTPSFPAITSGHIYGTSSRLGPAGQTTQIEDAPIVDAVAGMAYVWVQQDAAGTPNNAVFQFSTSFTSGGGTERALGQNGRTSEPVLSGAFDNIYISSESACTTTCTPTGNLYVTGDTGGGPGAILYRIPITANVMGTLNTGPTIGDAAFFGRSSPITEFFNATVAPTASVTISHQPKWLDHRDARGDRRNGEIHVRHHGTCGEHGDGGTGETGHRWKHGGQ